MRFFYFAILFSSMGFAQEKSYTVYFDTDVSEATIANGKKINDFKVENPQAVVTKVQGFCDQSGSDSYNDLLSQKRANFVIDRLKDDNVLIAETVKIEGLGEKFSTEINQQAYRKAVIYFEIQKPSTEKILERNELSEEISKLKIGEKLALPNLYFYNMSSQTVPASEKTLTDLLETMKANPNLKIEIQGHICCVVGTDNYDIATLRAKSVYGYLVTNGISKNRLRFKGFGNTQPVFPIPEKNETERDANRRVEIMILANE